MKYNEIIDGKKILVTGGTGSLGNQIINFIVEEGYKNKTVCCLY